MQNTGKYDSSRSTRLLTHISMLKHCSRYIMTLNLMIYIRIWLPERRKTTEPSLSHSNERWFKKFFIWSMERKQLYTTTALQCCKKNNSYLLQCRWKKRAYTETLAFGFQNSRIFISSAPDNKHHEILAPNKAWSLCNW